MKTKHVVTGSLILVASFGSLSAQVTGAPQLNSRPGAAYTIFLDVSGFDYDGLWSNHGTSPGLTPALNRDAITNSGAFTAAKQDQIKLMWARVAQSYVGLDANIITVDPAGTGKTDAQRQAIYDATPKVMHTVVSSQLRDSAPA